MSNIFLFLILLTSFLGEIYDSVAFAQVIPNAGALQQQIQKQIEIDNNSPPIPVTPKKKEEIKESTPSNQPKILVKEFDVTGATLVSKEKLDEVLVPYKNKNLTFSQLKEATSSISAYYQNLGKVAQVVIPPQDIVDGLVKMRVIEGKVGDVRIQYIPPEVPSRINPEIFKNYISNRNPKGQYLDLNQYEHSLGVINDLPSTIATGDLEQGSEEGYTDISLSVSDNGFVNGRVDLSNYGSVSTGVSQATGNLNFNNMLGIGDLLTLDAVATEGSTYGQIRYGAPIGSDGWRLALGISVLSYKTLSDWSPTIAQGNANVNGAYLSYPITRSSTKYTNFITNLEHKTYQNFATSSGNQAPVSDYYINSLTSGLNGYLLESEDYFSWGINLILGQLSINDPNQLSADTSITGANTLGAYQKITFNTLYKTPLPLNKTFLQFSLNGQIASKNLNSAEQFYLGGPYGIRAYPISQGGGSQGFSFSIDLTENLSDGLTVGTFFDMGGVQQYVNTVPGYLPNLAQQAGNFYYLYSTGLQAKYNILDSRVQLSGILGYRIGDNPLYSVSNGSYQQINSDNQYRKVQAWIKATYVF